MPNLFNKIVQLIRRCNGGDKRKSGVIHLERLSDRLTRGRPTKKGRICYIIKYLNKWGVG